MKINRFDSVHSANSFQSKPLLQGVAQTNSSLQSVVSDKLSVLSNHIEVGLYLAMTLSNLSTNSDAYFNTVTKRLEENKKKYDELSALVKPGDVVVDKMVKLAVDHAGNPRYTDPTTAFLGTGYVDNSHVNNVYVFDDDERRKIRKLISLLLYTLNQYKSYFTTNILNIPDRMLNSLNSRFQVNLKSTSVLTITQAQCLAVTQKIFNITPVPPNGVYLLTISEDREKEITGDIIKQLKDWIGDLVSKVQSKANITHAFHCASVEIFGKGRDSLGQDIIDKLSEIENKINFTPSILVRHSFIATDDELKKIIALVKNLQPSSTLTLAQLKDVSTALKLSELRSIVSDGRKKMLTLNALKDTDVIEIKKQVSNMQVLSEFFSGIMSAVKAMLSFFIDRMS